MFENCIYDVTGGVYCTYRGYPFHCTETDTPEQWAQLQELIETGEVTVAAYVAPTPLTAAQISASQADAARAQRDSLMSQCDWVVNRHRDQIDSGAATTLSPTQYQAWLTYRQALRDISKQTDWPATVAWPTAPIAASNAQM